LRGTVDLATFLRLACTMTIPCAAGGRIATTALLLAALTAASSCVSQEKAAAPVDAGPAQPRVASYNCGDGGLITVENLGALVRVTGTDGSVLELPAAPAAQRNRYGAGADAIVIEGREALFMSGRHEPLTCTR